MFHSKKMCHGKKVYLKVPRCTKFLALAIDGEGAGELFRADQPPTNKGSGVTSVAGEVCRSTFATADREFSAWTQAIARARR